MNFKAPKGIVEYARLYSLYMTAFPKCERKPFSIIREKHRIGKTDIWYFEDAGKFLGLCITINGDKEVLIDYFAVAERKRGQGNGRRMLNAMLKYYSPRGVFLEIEIPYESAENYIERVRRKKFYTSVGLSPMNTYVKLFGVDMELMGFGCHMTFDEYRNFYRENYGEQAYNNIKKVE